MRAPGSTFAYLVDRLDAERISGVLRGECDFDFISFASVGRSIHVSVKDIRYCRVLHEVTTVIPGTKYSGAELHPSYSDLHLYFRGRSEPVTIDAFQMNEEELENFFPVFRCATDSANEFLAFNDEDGDLISVHAGELTVAEVPHLDLLKEMDELDESFWEEEAPP